MGNIIQLTSMCAPASGLRPADDVELMEGISINGVDGLPVDGSKAGRKTLRLK